MYLIINGIRCKINDAWYWHYGENTDQTQYYYGYLYFLEHRPWEDRFDAELRDALLAATTPGSYVTIHLEIYEYGIRTYYTDEDTTYIDAYQTCDCDSCNP